MKFAKYDVVRILSLSGRDFGESDTFDSRAPQVGDIATILEIYDDPPGYELECSDSSGITEWLGGFRQDEVTFERVK